MVIFPFSCVVPPVVVVNEAAVRVELIKLVPLEVKVTVPRVPFVADPTAPVNVIPPEPFEISKVRASEAEEFSVEAKLIFPLLMLDKLVLAPKVTPSLKV